MSIAKTQMSLYIPIAFRYPILQCPTFLLRKHPPHLFIRNNNLRNRILPPLKFRIEVIIRVGR
jgi:hypothetical protein